VQLHRRSTAPVAARTPGRRTQGSAARRTLTWCAAACVAVLALLPLVAVAGPGSLVSGVVWADVNRDGVRQAAEAPRQGVEVVLLSAPGGSVVASTTSAAGGSYSFTGIADGTYTVRVDAPGAFAFPAATGGDNDFARPGAPGPGEPERGVSAVFAISGATTITALDAGMRPVASLAVDRLEQAVACERYAATGLPPFDASDGPGLDSGPGNCVVRVGDSVLQNYSVSLTDLPSGSVPNVVAEFTISSPDNARLELSGPGTNGLPSGCLAAANGANPASSRTVNPDGSIRVICNVGSMSSNVGVLQLAYRFTTDTPVPAHASIALRAYAAAGEAGTSATVAGPLVAVTGAARWDLEKVLYPPSGVGNAGPDFTVRSYDGGEVEGYLVRYRFNIVDRMGDTGGSELAWPVTFTDVMPEFPGAHITECRPGQGADDIAFSPWTLTCPIDEVQGADGWSLSIRPNSGFGSDTGQGHMIMTAFVPVAEMNRAIDPTWQPGDPTPTGTFDFDNRAQATEHWALNGGALNYGDGHEPGWEGTGNNLATRTSTAVAPRWDLQKNFRGGPTFSIETVRGERVPGYHVDYDFRVLDLAGPDNVGPWLDRPITFKDRLVSHPGAVLLSCRDLQPDPNVARTNCQTGDQPADGWTISATPNQRGFNNRRMDFIARIFIPLDQMAADPCASGVTLDLRNEAVGTERWTVAGQPNNGTGFEPGWDGTVATGNNLAVNKVRPSAGECGSLSGNKSFIRNGYTVNGQPTFGGDTITSFVSLSANNNRVKVPDLRLCDVFDVSVFSIASTPQMGTYPSGANVDPANYVIEYAVGPNSVDTQAGARGPNGLFPIDSSSISTAAAGCRDAARRWSTDPAADFGPDWRDHVNMVRVRPLDPDHVETGPFAAHLIFNLRSRTFYNGGPNKGEAIPSGVRLTNVGGWPTGSSGQTWGTGPREMYFTGMVLGLWKTVTPTQYLPGAGAVWDLNLSVDRATVGATLHGLQVVDTIPNGLHLDQACTRDLLPAGVTLSYDPTSRRATFHVADVPIVTAPTQWIYHASNGAPRLRVCTTVDTLAQPGDTYVNTAEASAANAENQPTGAATIQVVGSGQLGITKAVDKQLVASGEQYSWSLEWGNTSTVIAFQPPDVIDVLPWNGDRDPASGSPRSQYASDYTGTTRLTGPLAAPTYVRGGTGGSVPGTWYYSTAPPGTLNHDPRNPANADPGAAGGLWSTSAEVTDFGAVTAVRFVSSGFLPQQSRVRAEIAAVSTSGDLDNVYVNRAMVFSATFPNQPLLSNEPYVLMPGFALGDLVWRDDDGDGVRDPGERALAGVTVQVLDEDGQVVATRATSSAGRWAVSALPEGTYSVRIPSSEFQPGGPLEHYAVSTTGSSDSPSTNEGVDDNNTATDDPASTGLTSHPVTLAFTRSGDGTITGANGPSGDDVARLGDPMLPDQFTNFTIDLALAPVPGVDIEKATNTIDADQAPGPVVAVGGPVRWTYAVTNSGHTSLRNVTVTDDKVDAEQIDCGDGTNVVAGPLEPGDAFTCTATGTAVAGEYENTGTVVADVPDGTEVDDEDLSHYRAAAPAVDIEKATNTFDADDGPGPAIALGAPVRWTYLVTNTGHAELHDVRVTDDKVASTDIDCGDGSNVVPGPLVPGDSFTCVAVGAASASTYENTGTVVGRGPDTVDVDGHDVAGAEVSDHDLSHYHAVAPSVDVEKATNTFDADAAPGPSVAVGDPVRWTYVVTNSGTTALRDLVVSDDKVDAADIDCNGTDSNIVAGPLAAGDSFTCTATGTAVAGQYENTGSVRASGPESVGPDGLPVGTTVQDDDLSHYRAAVVEIDIEKATNGHDADQAPGPLLTVGDPVRWTYVVTNTGDTALRDVVVTDDRVASAAIDCDSSGSNLIAGPLAPAASFTCVATGTAVEGAYENTGTVAAHGPATVDVNGDPVPGLQVSDQDLSHYTGRNPQQGLVAGDDETGGTGDAGGTGDDGNAAGPRDSGLPDTGGPDLRLLPLGLGLVVVGLGALVLARRDANPVSSR
jgi:hypothetical protein